MPNFHFRSCLNSDFRLKKSNISVFRLAKIAHFRFPPNWQPPPPLFGLTVYQFLMMIQPFNHAQAVDALPFDRGVTRIDLALREAQRNFFTPAMGARLSAAKIVIVLTDGKQTTGRADYVNPATVAQELRDAGISTIVVGMGSGKTLYARMRVNKLHEIFSVFVDFTSN